MLLPGLYDWFLDSTALKHFTEAAPGFEELMCLGKIYDLVSDSKYDRVVFDGPATGHAALMLRVPRTTGAAVRTGPLHHNALKIQLMLENDMTTRIVIVVARRRNGDTRSAPNWRATSPAISRCTSVR